MMEVLVFSASVSRKALKFSEKIPCPYERQGVLLEKYPQGPAPGRSLFGGQMKNILRKLWSEDEGQDIAEYAVMLAVILVIVVGTIRLIGSNANNVFSSVASSIQ
jgi:Flp pilus assembly pilin Flp